MKLVLRISFSAVLMLALVALVEEHPWYKGKASQEVASVQTPQSEFEAHRDVFNGQWVVFLHRVVVESSTSRNWSEAHLWVAVMFTDGESAEKFAEGQLPVQAGRIVLEVFRRHVNAEPVGNRETLKEELDRSVGPIVGAGFLGVRIYDFTIEF